VVRSSTIGTGQPVTFSITSIRQGAISLAAKAIKGSNGRSSAGTAVRAKQVLTRNCYREQRREPSSKFWDSIVEVAGEAESLATQSDPEALPLGVSAEIDRVDEPPGWVAGCLYAIWRTR